ncbi:sulfotransferase family 2 domain-containing protein [Microbulbifer thermotolerans]|uniref:sulfotransferase family 2 domain-containing protein n=1 Tax=Microbulbifer thermotolerans TaxID=252514 RepID=UPI00224966FF|nr:sulfotransferase family 2 domain-containing protein [Microbulbifer thermotolerans]MCX2831889.1 sulfotransferase family protein [Microbulbifer thermotolerans]
MNPFVFVHIPKTAGTSFRIGADAYWGRARVCRDYGPKSPETSEIVNKWLVETPDKWKFKKAFVQEGYEFLTGHIRAIDYAPIFGVGRMVTFVREPLQRIVSEFKHVVRHYGYKGDFTKFYRAPHNINRQHRALAGIPWPAIGFIGLTERYTESLNLFNQKYDVGIPGRQENRGRADINVGYELPLEQETELRKLNAADIRLYEEISAQFEWRLRLVDSEIGFVTGLINKLDNGLLYGWALADQGDDPVLVQARAGGEVIGEALANQYRPGLREKGVGRGGFVGFSIDIGRLKGGEKVECVVASTGQPLVHSPWTVHAGD